LWLEPHLVLLINTPAGNGCPAQTDCNSCPVFARYERFSPPTEQPHQNAVPAAAVLPAQRCPIGVASLIVNYIDLAVLKVE